MKIVLRREGEKLTLLFAQKTGETFPHVASGKANTVAYSYDAVCGTLKGSLAWDGTKVSNKEQSCDSL